MTACAEEDSGAPEDGGTDAAQSSRGAPEPGSTDEESSASEGESSTGSDAGSGDSTGADTGDEVELLAYHDGYWVSPLDVGMPGASAVIVNDMHIDLSTRSATVYAQVQAFGMVVSPPQVGPGECTTAGNDETVCFHPNAVYLNGSGEELDEATGDGEWWIKHAWVVDGEGYTNCEPVPLQETYDDCLWARGELLEDGVTLSMHVGEWGTAGAFNNRRRRRLDEVPICYEVANYLPAGTLGERDPEPELQWISVYDCVETPSALDGEARPCPALAGG